MRFFACLLLSAAPAQAQTFLSPLPLPGDAIVSPSAGNQFRPDIALGSGTSLAVWQDDRSSSLTTVFGGGAAGSSIPGNMDVFGVLLDPALGVMTSAPIVIDHESWDQVGPKVAFNGSDYLVVFESTRPTAFYKSQGIYGVRVSALGVVLDSTPIRIADLDPDDETAPVVASAGGSWMVAWNGITSGGYWSIDGAIVSANGSVGPRRALVPGSVTGVPTDVCIAAASGRSLLATPMTGARLQCRRFDANGSPLGASFDAATGADVYQPALGSNATDFYLAWTSTPAGVRGTPIDANGVVAIPGGLTLSTYASDLGVGWDGAAWSVAAALSPDVLSLRVSTAGQIVTAPSTLTTSPRTIGNIAVGNGVGRVGVLWADTRENPSDFGLDITDVFGATVDSNGSASAPVPITISPPCQLAARIAGDASTGFLLVYRSLTAGRTRILAQPVDANGIALSAEPYEIESGDRSLGDADVAFANGVFLVAWPQLQSTAQTGPPSLIKTRRCRIDGTFLDAAPQTLMEGFSPNVDDVGGTFLVVARFQHILLQYQSVVRGRRIDAASGAVLDPAPILIQFAANGATEVVGLTDRWLVVWGNLVGAFVMSDGTPLTPFHAANIGAAPSSAVRVSRNAARDRATLVYQYRPSGGPVHTTDVRMRRFAVDGSSTETLEGLVVSNANQAQLSPTAAVLEDESVFAWADHRAHLDIEPGLGDVYAARMDALGTPLTPQGSPVRVGPSAEGGVELYACGPHRALAASVRLEGASFGNHRLSVGLYEEAGVGASFCAGDGSGTSCPCANSGAANHGCASSLNPAGASLRAFGSASVANDTITLLGEGLTNSTCLYFQGTARVGGGSGLAFGDGLRCAGGSIVRLATKLNVGGVSQYPSAGDPTLSLRGAVPSIGGVRTYQVWYRNAASFCTASTFNLSNGVELSWIP